jgi:CBS domain-containing protein
MSVGDAPPGRTGDGSRLVARSMQRVNQMAPASGGGWSLDASYLGLDLTTPVGTLLTRPLLEVSAEASVSQAARAMGDAEAGAALVAADPPGLVTDRDLRSRVLAADLGPDTPVRDVMSRPIESSPTETPVFDALRRMLELNVHHLLLTQDGRAVGIVSDTELIRHQAGSPLLLLDQIERLERTVDAPPEYSRDVAGVARSLFEGGLGVLQVAQVLTTLGDALTRRLVTLAELELGEPPCPYSWIALGSEGRMEQVLLTDQDNALVYLREERDAGVYFEALARRVVDGLVRAGYPPCPGGFMATNWCRPLADWVSLFRRWIEVPEPGPLLKAQVFLDFRPVAGDLSLDPLDRILLSGGRDGLFLHHMARAALGFRPPLGAFGRVKTGDGSLDLKLAGIAATVMLARLHALAAGAGPRPTLQRLQAAADAGTLSRSGAEILGETFRFLTRLRLRQQLQALHDGEAPGDRVLLQALSPLERRRLKEALQAVRKLQDATARRFPDQ